MSLIGDYQEFEDMKMWIIILEAALDDRKKESFEEGAIGTSDNGLKREEISEEKDESNEVGEQIENVGLGKGHNGSRVEYEAPQKNFGHGEGEVALDVSLEDAMDDKYIANQRLEMI